MPDPIPPHANHGRFQRIGWELGLPLVLLACLSYWLAAGGLDLAAQRYFYTQGAGNGWPVGNLPVFRFLYRYGSWLGLSMAIVGLIMGIAAIWVRSWRDKWRAAVFFPLLMIIGPGLLVNSAFKNHWGRPRPVQIVEFGGTQAYSPPWLPSAYKQGKSFPSGHASMGFYLLAPYFLYRHRRRGLSLVWLGTGLLGGALMGVMRMAMGGHFLSDVMWSGGVVYITGWFLAAWLLPPPACDRHAGR
jgi:membrane-associated PAP2 superfamily phosphatase